MRTIHGRPHDARTTDDHDVSDPVDLQTLKIGAVVIAVVITVVVAFALLTPRAPTLTAPSSAIQGR